MPVITKGLFMKKFLLFLGGFVCGIVITFFVLIVLAGTSNSDNGINMFEEPGECLAKGSVEIFQVLEPTAALAHTKGDYGYDGTLVLLVNDENKAYYDEQIVKADKCFRQIGTYQYETKGEFLKTVPIVMAE